MADARPLTIPVILGTAREGRMSATPRVTKLIDVGALPIRLDARHARTPPLRIRGCPTC